MEETSTDPKTAKTEQSSSTCFTGGHGDQSNTQEMLKHLAESVRDAQAELANIRNRNKEKELEKQFEGSYLRMFSIMVITYFTLFGYMTFLGVKLPALNALVPTTGFFLSTWSLSCALAL